MKAELFALQIGNKRCPESSLFGGGGSASVEYSCFAYLVRSSRRLILVDPGFGDAVSARRDGYEDFAVQEGIPVTLIINAEEDYITGCNNRVISNLALVIALLLIVLITILYSTNRRRKNMLTVGAMDSARRLTPMENTDHLMRTNSGITITTEYVPINNWFAYIQNGSIDIMTTLSFELPYIDNSLAYETIYTCPLLACMLKTNPLAGKKSIELSELKDQEFIFNSPQVFPSYCKYYSQLCYESGFGPKITKYVNSPHSLIWNIQNDNEVLLCDMFIRDIESPLISRVEIKGQTSSLVTFWKKDNNNPLIRMYIQMLKKEFASYQPEQDMGDRGLRQNI